MLLPFGIPVLGFLWIHPLSQETPLSVRKFLFACLWFVVTLVPALGLMTAADALLDTQLPVFREFNAPSAMAGPPKADPARMRAVTAP